MVEQSLRGILHESIGKLVFAAFGQRKASEDGKNAGVEEVYAGINKVALRLLWLFHDGDDFVTFGLEDAEILRVSALNRAHAGNMLICEREDIAGIEDHVAV